jgi:DNA-binding CsgD family transcriptional regulator/tetratricopeptide (TPR) repeat protein
MRSLFSGHGSVVLIEGAAGNGKTRLLDEATDGIADEITVIRGRADELEKHRPFGPLAVCLGLAKQAVDPRRREVAVLLSGAEPAGPGPVQLGHVADARFRAVDAVVDLVQELAATPTLLVLDDLQWADESTLLALRQLARRTRYLPLVVVLSFREPAAGTALAQLRGSLLSDGATHIQLAELPPASVAELVEATLGGPAGRTLQPALDEAGGSPLFVAELLRSLVAEDRFTLATGRVELTGDDLPVSFVATVRRQVDALRPRTATVLRAAAVAGTDVAVRDVVAITTASEPDVVDALTSAVDNGVLVDAGERLAFRHGLVQRAIYQSIPAELRRSQHRALADALQRANASVERIAWHLAAGTDAPNRDIATWLRAAAVEEAVAAPAVAADLLMRALEFLPADDPERQAVTADLARELVWAGHTEDGASRAESVLAVDDDPQLRATLALARLLQGRYVDAVVSIERAASNAGIDPITRAQLRAEAGLARFLSGDMAGAERDGAEAVEEGLELGDDLAICVGLCTQSWTANARGEQREALMLAEDAVRRARSSTGAALARYSPHLFLGIVLLGQGRSDDAATVFREGRAIAESAGTLLNLPAYHACLALVQLYAGEWDDTVAECEAGLVAADELDATVGVVWLHALRGLVLVHRDELKAADEAVRAGEAVMVMSGPQIGADWLMLARALITQAEDAPTALAILGNAWDLYESLGIRSHHGAIGPELARSALDQGDITRATAVRDALEAGNDEPHVTEHLTALIARDPEQLLLVAEDWRAAGRPFEHGRCMEDAAVAFATAGNADDAARAFAAASDILEGLGAVRDIARVGAEQRAAGISRGKRGRRTRPSRGWDSLTDTEVNVVRLVAEGLTNRQIGDRLFISRRTVETHVSHVFTKLDVSSRAHVASAFSGR